MFQVVNVNSKYENRGYAFEETKLKNGRKLIWVGTSFPANLVAIDNKTADIVNYSCPSSLKMGFVFSIEKLRKMFCGLPLTVMEFSDYSLITMEMLWITDISLYIILIYLRI